MLVVVVLPAFPSQQAGTKQEEDEPARRHSRGCRKGRCRRRLLVARGNGGGWARTFGSVWSCCMRLPVCGGKSYGKVG
jgi:hypothetical protein